MSKYGTDEDFEQIAAALAASNPKFWQRIGQHVEPDLLENAGAQTIFKLCREIANEHQPTPELIKQRAAFLVEDGKLTTDNLALVKGTLELAKETWDVEAIISELVGPVRQAKYRAIAKRVTSTGVSAHEPKFDQFIDDMLLCDKLGTDEIVQDKPASEFGIDTEELLASAPSYIQMPTGIGELDILLRGGPGMGSLVTVLMDSKAGKCARRDTPILMMDGTIKPVQDVRVGDRLMGPDSRPRVVHSTNCGVGEMYEIRPKRGKPWFVNLEHVLTLEAITKLGGRPWKRRIVDVSVRDWLGWSDTRKRNSRLFTPDAVEFDRKQPELPIDPYFMGVYLGDGSSIHTGNSVSITSKDAEIIDCVYTQAKKHNLRIRAHTNRSAGSYYLCTNECGEPNPIVDAIKSMGLYGLSSGEKFIPDDYKLGTKEARLQVLAGLIDTDGHLTKKVTYDYISKSERLAEDVAFVARSLGMSALVKPCRKSCQTGATGTYYRVSIGQSNGQIPVRLERKRASSKLRIGYDSRKTPFEVIRTGMVDAYYGFTLDADSRYLNGDFTVTHNSMTLNHFSSVAALHGENVGILSLEGEEHDQHRRLLAAISGVPINDFVDEHARKQANDIVRKLYKQNKLGKIVIGSFQPKTLNERDVLAWFDRQEKEKGIRLRYRVIDYGDLIVSSKREDRESEYRTGFTVWSALKAMSQGDGKPNWVITASQAKRPDWKPGQVIPILNRSGTGDSRHKYQLSDLFLTGTPQPDISARNGYIWLVDADRHFGATGQATDVVPHFRHMGRMADISHLGL